MLTGGVNDACMMDCDEKFCWWVMRLVRDQWENENEMQVKNIQSKEQGSTASLALSEMLLDASWRTLWATVKIS